jgi:hypothetical protein
MGELTDKLMAQYATDAAAFIRFFLTPAMILKMSLESNYTAALSERLNALEKVVAEYGLNDEIITAPQFRQEQRALTTALTFMKLGAAQFEVSWDAFRADAHANSEDEFKAYLAFNKTYNDLPILSEARKETAHVFSNKQVQKYEFQNRTWPLVLTICAILDVFLSHPSYGIEAILAVRIRHDNLRREFAVALSELKRVGGFGATKAQRDHYFDRIGAAVYSALQAWIDRYMHTKGSGLPDAIFDFVPDQSEMGALVAGAADVGSLNELVDQVTVWIQDRLKSTLAAARAKLVCELKPSLASAIRSTQEKEIAAGAISRDAAESISAAAETIVTRRADDLLNWFETPTQVRSKGLTYEEMRWAVEGRFAAEVASQELQMSLYAPTLGRVEISPDDIRPVFDLWSELVMNAVKYSHRKITRVRVTEFEDGPMRGLLFSSLCRSSPLGSREYVAEPNLTPNELASRAGKSGLHKVARLAAATTKSRVSIRAVQRRRSFHVMVPLLAVRS